MTLQEQTYEIQKFINDNPSPTKINSNEIKIFYQNLIDCIVDHNHLYYVDSEPIISDYEYDQLFAYLKKIEEDFPYIISGNSPTQKLVNQIQDGFKKGNHLSPLLSLENSYNANDILERADRTKKIAEKEGIECNYKFLVEPKFDGLSIELIYEDGELIKGITRGDGYIGEDVTANINTIKNIPKKLKIKLPGTYSFRGEVLIGKDELEKINQQREKEGQTIYANTRNLASGSLKQLDPNVTAQRNLQCFVYENIYAEKDLPRSMQELGLPIHPRNRVYNSINEVISLCENPDTKILLSKENIDFDGLVIKIVGEEIRKKIGYTQHHPRRAIAYKFPATQISTEIESVDFQVGRTGIITPVANLKPVQLSGVTISRVSMHNFDFIKEKDIHYNDHIRIQRSGEVIPYISGVIKESRTNENLITAPENCPSCGNKLKNIDIHYYCENPNCPAQIKEKIIRFVSKECMDIEGIGENIIDILVEHNIIKNITDLYKLLDFETERVIRKFPGFAEKKIVEIQNQLKDSKQREFRRLINGLGIPGIGKKTAKDINKALGEKFKEKTNLNDITQYLTDHEFLIGIYGVGDKIVDGIIGYRNDNKDLLEKLENLGLNFNCYSQKENTDSKGHFCITGTFENSREDIIKSMENNGYIFDSNPNKNTNFILVGEKPGSKLTKAEESGIEIINDWNIITERFNFLKHMQNKKDSNGPVQIGLF